MAFVNSANALIEIDPPSASLSKFSDEYFFADVTISGVDNVYGFQLDLSYDPNVFEVEQFSDVSEGTFLNRSGQDRTFCLDADISTPGLVKNFGCSRIGSGSVSGSGILANVKLKLKSPSSFPATSDIILSKVKISDIDSGPLDNSTQDGYVTVYECFEGEKTDCLVGGQQGTKTCNSDKEWGSCEIYFQVSDGGSSGGSENGGLIVPFTETEEEDEVSFYSGDVNIDGCVDILDLAIVGANFGMHPGDPGFDTRADINLDGEVIMYDIVIVGISFGQGYNC